MRANAATLEGLYTAGGALASFRLVTVGAEEGPVPFNTASAAVRSATAVDTSGSSSNDSIAWLFVRIRPLQGGTRGRFSPKPEKTSPRPPHAHVRQVLRQRARFPVCGEVCGPHTAVVRARGQLRGHGGEGQQVSVAAIWHAAPGPPAAR